MVIDPPTILLVEDDSNDVLLIERAFRKANVNTQIEIVADGDEAIAYLTQQSLARSDALPALVLLDLKLPRRSGLEVLEWVRQQPLLKRLLVVVLTSSRESPDIARAYDLGVNSYLVKPVVFDDLVILATYIHQYWLDCNEQPTFF
ncbi:MAG: response regulator [Cyanophyceae cyanobacterium]